MKTHNAILIIVTGHAELSDQRRTGLWLEEYAVPAAIFKAQGKSVTVASLNGGAAPIDPESLPEQPDTTAITAQQELQDTRPLDTLDLSQFDAVFFPGGHGAMFDLPGSGQIGSTISDFLQSGRIVGAVCHGPAALVGARLEDGTPVVQGRKLTSFTNEEERAVGLDSAMPFLLQSRLSELGAEFVTSPNWNDHVIVDGTLITGQNPQSSASTAQAILDALASA